MGFFCIGELASLFPFSSFFFFYPFLSFPSFSDHTVLKAAGKWLSLLTSANKDQCEQGPNGVISSLLLGGRLEPRCPGDCPSRREPEGGTTETLDYMVEWIEKVGNSGSTLDVHC